MKSFTRVSSLSFSLCLVLCAGLISAQEKQLAVQLAPVAQAAPQASGTATGASDFSKEAIVYEKCVTRIVEQGDGTGTRETTVRMRIQADAGVKAMAVLQFGYTASNQQMEIKTVRVTKPDGSVVVTPAYNVQDMPADVSREAPMYSDLHQKHVAVRGLGVGDTLEYQVLLRTFQPEVPGQFWLEYTFQKNAIALDEQLDLDVPADKQVNVSSARVQPSIRLADGRKLYHWSSSNLQRPDPDAPSESVRKWKPSVQVSTFTSWEQIGAWYDGLQKEALTITPAVQARAAAVTKGLSTDEQKLRALYDDVELHVHYIGLAFGIGRYQPHNADDVLVNEYGDCKDKHTLLATLLKASGIEARPVLISSKRFPDGSIPSPAQFDHVITFVHLGEKDYWMDATGETLPMGVLHQALRDKQGLLITPGGTATLKVTPADLPAPRSIQVGVEGALSETGTFTGKFTEVLDGDIGATLRLAVRRIPQSQWKEMVERLAHSLGFGGQATNPVVSEVDQIDEPFKIGFDYTREKYNMWNDSKDAHWIGSPMPPIGGELAPGIKQQKQEDDVELGATGQTHYHSILQLPAGWTLVPPKNVDMNYEWMEYHSRYSLVDGKLIADRLLLIKKNKIPLAQWEDYLVFRRGLYNDENEQALLTEIKGKGKRK